MRALVHGLDWLLRRAYGVFVFCEEADCILRLRVRKSPRSVELSDQFVIARGDLVLELHLWNERVPPIPSNGPDVAWAVRTHRMFLSSLHKVCRWMDRDARSSGVRAVCGNTVLFFSGDHPTGVRMMERLGFKIVPYRNPLGRFGEFWDNLYAYALMWAFNEASLQHRRFFSSHRAEMWMPVESFLYRYGEREGEAA